MQAPSFSRRLPAALRWLLIGGGLWLCWRVPVVMHDLASLFPLATAHAAGEARPAPSTNAAAPSPVDPVAKIDPPEAKSVPRPWQALAKSVVVEQLPYPEAPSRQNLAEAPMGSPSLDEPEGYRLAQQGYERLRAGDRRGGANLLAKALKLSPADPRSNAWIADLDALHRRWSGDAYLLFRHGGEGTAFGTTPSLGGSQLGARLSYELDPLAADRIAIAGRFYQPLKARDGRFSAAQAAVGIEWQPQRNLPVTFTAERYLALGTKARNAWSIRASGGLNGVTLPFDMRLSGYAQAGVVGLHSTDGFVDGWLKITQPVPNTRFDLSLGAGLWSGAQPGVSRLDIGPTAQISTRLGHTAIRGSLDYRLRQAGNARPGNGPALTLTAGF